MHEVDQHYPRTWPEESNRCHQCSRGRLREDIKGNVKCDNPDCPSNITASDIYDAMKNRRKQYLKEKRKDV